jgi:hypothetical protein
MDAARLTKEIVSRKKDERGSSRMAKVRRGIVEGTEVVKGSEVRSPAMPRQIPPIPAQPARPWARRFCTFGLAGKQKGRSSPAA